MSYKKKKFGVELPFNIMPIALPTATAAHSQEVL